MGEINLSARLASLHTLDVIKDFFLARLVVWLPFYSNTRAAISFLRIGNCQSGFRWVTPPLFFLLKVFFIESFLWRSVEVFFFIENMFHWKVFYWKCFIEICRSGFRWVTPPLLANFQRPPTKRTNSHSWDPFKGTIFSIAQHKPQFIRFLICWPRIYNMICMHCILMQSETLFSNKII